MTVEHGRRLYRQRHTTSAAEQAQQDAEVRAIAEQAKGGPSVTRGRLMYEARTSEIVRRALADARDHDDATDDGPTAA